MNYIKSFINRNQGLTTLMATLIILATGCILLPIAVTLACRGLLYMINQPVNSLFIIGAYLFGILSNELAGTLDKKVSK